MPEAVAEDILGNFLIRNACRINKTHFDSWIWDQATYHGQRWALLKILDHNEKDVEICRQVWKLAESNFSIPAKYA